MDKSTLDTGVCFMPSLSYDDLLNLLKWFEGLQHTSQIMIAVGAIIVAPWLVIGFLLRRHYRNKHAGEIDRKDTEIRSHQLANGIKDATIASKDATIEQLRVRLEATESSVRSAIVKADRPATTDDLHALQQLLAKTEAPLLEFQPDIMVMNPLKQGNASVRVFLTIEVRNLGAPTSLHGWQVQVRLPTRSMHLTENVLNHNEKAETANFPSLVNLVSDEQIIQKGGKRKGWIEFQVVGDPTRGEIFPMNVKQVIVSVCDYTGKRYELPVPSFEMPFEMGRPADKQD